MLSPRLAHGPNMQKTGLKNNKKNIGLLIIILGARGFDSRRPTRLLDSGDHSRPPKPNEIKGLSENRKPPPLVSGGLERAPVRHKSVTSDMERLKQALRSTSHLGTRECHHFRKRIFSQFFPLVGTLERHYLRVAEETSYRQANLSLLELESRLLLADLNLTWADSQLQAFAEEKAAYCQEVTRLSRNGGALQQCLDHMNRYGIEPNFKTVKRSSEGWLKRFQDPVWWRRQIRIRRKRALEGIARDLGIVSKRGSQYCSKWGLSLHRQEQKRNRKLLESYTATNGEGQSFTLAELADLSVSNPAVRKAELMVRVRGFEEVANFLGHAAEFYTLTTPSRMHAQLSKGVPNPRFDGTTPRQAQAYLAHTWAVARAALSRLGIQVYGFRVAEPHHDGTPHWHMALFMRHDQVQQVRETIRHYALLEDGDEPGAQRHRFEAVAIDSDEGSATGYIAKYVSKNIDGEGIEVDDETGRPGKESAEHVRAWASTWGIRQFQQIGGPSVTVWRELRRLDSGEDGVLEEARQAADSSDWAAYVMAMGGPTLPARDRPIRAALWIEEDTIEERVDISTGEILTTYRTRYGEKPVGRIFGLLSSGRYVLTRFYRWTVERAQSPGAQTCTRSVLSARMGDAPPWTCVNNCTAMT